MIRYSIQLRKIVKLNFPGFGPRISQFSYGKLVTYIDGSCPVDRLSCSLVSPVNRRRQSDGYQWCLFRCCGNIVKWRRHQIKVEELFSQQNTHFLFLGSQTNSVLQSRKAVCCPRPLGCHDPLLNQKDCFKTFFTFDWMYCMFSFLLTERRITTLACSTVHNPLTKLHFLLCRHNTKLSL